MCMYMYVRPSKLHYDLQCKFEPPQDKPNKMTCAQWRRRSTWAFEMPGCPGWSESSLGLRSFCWFCHAVAHLICSVLCSFVTVFSLHLQLLQYKNLQLWPVWKKAYHCRICLTFTVCNVMFQYFLCFYFYLQDRVINLVVACFTGILVTVSKCRTLCIVHFKEMSHLVLSWGNIPKRIRTCWIILLAKSTKSSVQIFKQWNSHAVLACFLLENPQDGLLFVCMMLRGKTLRPGMIVLSMFLLTSTLLSEMMSDVRFCNLTPFCTRFNIRNIIISMTFSAIFNRNQVKCKNSDHPCRFYCINIFQVTAALCSNNFFGTLQILMHEKTWMIPIFTYFTHCL